MSALAGFHQNPDVEDMLCIIAQLERIEDERQATFQRRCREIKVLQTRADSYKDGWETRRAKANPRRAA